MPKTTLRMKGLKLSISTNLIRMQVTVHLTTQAQRSVFKKVIHTLEAGDLLKKRLPSYLYNFCVIKKLISDFTGGIRGLRSRSKNCRKLHREYRGKGQGERLSAERDVSFAKMGFSFQDWNFWFEKWSRISCRKEKLMIKWSEKMISFV